MDRHILRDFTPYHPLSYLPSSHLLFLAFDWPGAEAYPAFVVLPWYKYSASSGDEMVGEEVIG